MSETTRSGNLIIVSGPSGAGKSILASRVLQQLPHLKFSVSYTTRAPRGAEQNGVEYFFVGREEFQTLIRGNDLLEWAEVYGNYYGTSRKFVDDLLLQGEDVLLDIDVQGAAIVRKNCPDAVGIFIMPPSYQVLRERLMRRSLDDGFVIEKRLQIAGKEIRHYRDYDYLIINEELNRSTLQLQSIILGARCRTAAGSESAESVIATFGGVDA
ncbi:MAG TPA: guanylate kinase [Acidobacteriota bacterium]|nr:guanylate kinase [Acidobacteriota bacterium]